MPWISLSSLALIGSLVLTWWLHRFHRLGLRVTPGIAASAFVVAITVGVIGAVAPALRASQIRVIEALRKA